MSDSKIAAHGFSVFYNENGVLEHQLSWEDEGERYITLQVEAAQQLKKEQNARRRKAYLNKKCQKLAAVHGLEAWSTLRLNKSNVEDLALFESILKQTSWLRLPLNGEEDHDDCGWLTEGRKGKDHLFVAASDALVILKSADRQTDKIAALLELLCARRWAIGKIRQLEGASLKGIEDANVGSEWVNVHRPGLGPRMSVAVFQALGRTPDHLRWALIRKLSDTYPLIANPTVRINHADLDWETLKQAQVSPAVRMATYPPKVQWERLFGFPAPYNLEVADLCGFKLGVFRELCGMVGLTVSEETLTKGIGLAQPLFNLVRLFGDTSSIRRFVVATRHEWSEKGLHDAGQFKLAVKQKWTPSKWAPLCLRYPTAVSHAADFPGLEKKGVFPTTLAQFRRERARLSYPEIQPGSETLAELCLANGLPGADFEQYQEFWKTVKVKTAEFLPNVVVEGPEVGLPEGWRFEKLEAQDYRGPMLGQLTGCCQHLGGAGRDSAVAGVTSPYSGFYVVTHHNTVIAQSWAWVNNGTGLVFDSVESLIRTEAELAPVIALYKAGAERMLGKLGIKGVFLGDTPSGVTRIVEAGLVSERAITISTKPVDGCGYFDGRYHRRVTGKETRKNPQVPSVDGYTPGKAKEPDPYYEPVFRRNRRGLADLFMLPDGIDIELERQLGQLGYFF